MRNVTKLSITHINSTCHILNTELADDVSMQLITYFAEPQVRSKASIDFVKKIADLFCKLDTYVTSPSLPTVNILL